MTGGPGIGSSQPLRARKAGREDVIWMIGCWWGDALHGET